MTHQPSQDQDLRTALAAKADEQVAYWRERQAAEKSPDDGISEDGETYTPIGDVAAWQGGYCNGRMSEADWWRQTLLHLPPAAAPTPSRGSSVPTWILNFIRDGARTVLRTSLPGGEDRGVAERAAKWADEQECSCVVCVDARARQAATPTPPLSPDSTGPAGARAKIWKERLERVFFDAGGFHGQMIEYAARTALPIVLWACDAASPSAREPLAVIEFAQTMDDQGEMREFLRSWSEGDTSEWPEFFKFLAALTPSAPIAAPVRDDGARITFSEQHHRDAVARSVTPDSDGERLARVVSDADLLHAALGTGCSKGFVPETIAAVRQACARGDGAREALTDLKAAADELAQLSVAEGDNKAAGALQWVSGFISDRLASLPASAGDVPGEAQTQEGGR